MGILPQQILCEILGGMKNAKQTFSKDQYFNLHWAFTWWVR